MNKSSYSKPFLSRKIFLNSLMLFAIIVSTFIWIEIDVIFALYYISASVVLNIVFIEFFGDFIYHKKEKYNGILNYTTYTTDFFKLSYIDGTKILHNEHYSAVTHAGSDLNIEWWLDGRKLFTHEEVRYNEPLKIERFSLCLKQFKLSKKVSNFN